MRRYGIIAALTLLLAGAANGQDTGGSRLFVEGLGGAVVPTFDIADVAKTGGALGAAVGVRLSPRVVLMGEFDYGMHKDKATGNVDINTAHYMGKLGYSLTGPRSRGFLATAGRRPPASRGCRRRLTRGRQWAAPGAGVRSGYP